MKSNILQPIYNLSQILFGQLPDKSFVFWSSLNYWQKGENTTWYNQFYLTKLSKPIFARLDRTWPTSGHFTSISFSVSWLYNIRLLPMCAWLCRLLWFHSLNPLHQCHFDTEIQFGVCPLHRKYCSAKKCLFPIVCIPLLVSTFYTLSKWHYNWTWLLLWLLRCWDRNNSYCFPQTVAVPVL